MSDLKRESISYFIIQNTHLITLYKAEEDESFSFKPYLMKSLPLFKHITGTIHSGCSFNIEQHMFLFDEKNMYVIKMNPPECLVYNDINCIGLQMFDKNYSYALCKEGKKDSGIKVFNMENIIQRNENGMLLVK